VLATGGVTLTDAYGEQHPSQPNYYWLFSGSNQGITSDANNSNVFGSDTPFNTPNLYTELQQASSNPGQLPSTNFFGGYVDGFDTTNPYIHENTNTSYVTRHVPWLGFTNINNGNPAEITQDFTNSPLYTSTFSNLPVLSFVIPSLTNDMHYTTNPPGTPDGTSVSNTVYSQQAVSTGDAWLSNNLSAYASWARSNNSLLIVTWDEDHTADWTTNANNPENASGLTAPNLGPSTNSNSGPNQIAMLFYGANLATNGFVSTTLNGTNTNGVNNLNLYDTLQSFYGISNYGSQSDVAAAAGLISAPITDIFSVPEPSARWLLLSGLGVLALIRMRRKPSC